MAKTAYARRTGGNTYDVTYERSVAMDSSVGGEYLNRPVERGFTVECDNGGYDSQRLQIGRLVSGEVKWSAK